MAARTGLPYQPTIPQVSTPFVDEGGNITEAWHLLLVVLWQAITPGAVQAIALTGSPLVFVAPFNGSFVADGGSVAISRGGGTPVTVATAGGAIPLGKGDTVTYTYSGTPSVAFWPG